MRYNHILYLLVVMCSCFGIPLTAQSSCGPEVVVDTNGFSGTAFFNYGSQARSKSQSYRTSIAVGQTFVGYMEDLNYNSTVGFYSRFLLAPFALKVFATQGDLLDRIQVAWEIDALGPSPNEGFNIYRDGVFLATVGANIRNYNDFNVIPGRPYIYTVRGLNAYGEGASSDALGFQVPNGVVTGWISTLSGSPVPDALVTLTPMQGFSAKFGAEDGAFAIASANQNSFLPTTGEDWTMTFWVKTQEASEEASLISMRPLPLYIRAINSNTGDEGVVVSASATGAPFLIGTFPDSNKNSWHHVALSFDGNSNQGRLYVDGVLNSIAPMTAVSSPDSLHISGSGDWDGRLDELRIYHRKLDELDFNQVMEGTASSQTPFLSHYWKMDEELGVKSYDLVKRHKLFFCGASFDADRPPVHTAGITNEDGYYTIESASYGTGTTFLAQPKKNFYMHRALKMNRDEEDYASLPDFSITPKATIELWVNSAGPDETQCVLSKKWGANEFRLMLVPNVLDNDIVIHLNGQEENFGNFGNGYQHLAFTFDSMSGNVTGYKNGVLLNTFTFAGVTGNWSDPVEGWLLGARTNGASHTDYFGGLIDEVAVYDTTLSAASIQDHFENARDIQERGLRVYFPLDEGNGIKLGNIGSVFLDGGTTLGTEWSALAAHQDIEPHVFTPATRQVTLNPSVTSVDQVDFTDRSTVPVSGFVRYKNTDCFAQNVEILVNGASFNPQIFTDSTGRFVIDFDPGSTATLSPKFADHVFIPAIWDVISLSSPIAGIVFNDITTRTISGQVAGGVCKKSIITAPPGSGQGTVCVVKVRTPDGCLERQITLDNQDGNFEFTDLPPIEKMTVAVVEHSNPLIKTAFQVQGGSTVNLSKQDTMIDFIYTAMPEIEIVSGLDPYSPSCSTIVLDQFEHVELGIKLKEQYVATVSDDGVCYIDSANFHIINGFGDEILDTTMGNGLLVYEFIVGTPNPTPPYLKTFQIISETLDGNDSEYTVQAVVTGLRAKDNTFTTVLPETPTLVLRDPPGDGSYSYLEKNEKVCQKISFTKEVTTGAGASAILDVGPDVTIPIFFGAPDVEFVSIIGPTITATSSMTKVNENSIEVCTSFDERISTSENNLIVGGHQGGDVYVGGGLNVEFGFADIVRFDTASCMGVDSVTVIVVPGDYATTFMYSEWHIKSAVLFYLQNLAAQATDTTEQNIYLESIDRWNTILDNNTAQKAAAKFQKNISFDAGVSYEYSETSDTAIVASQAMVETIKLDVDLNFQLYLLGIGGGVVIKVAHEDVTSESEDGLTEQGVTTGYVLKDDDPLDAYTIDVCMDSVYKTPVFNIKAGQSSCPWEYGTAKRQGVLLTSVDGPFRTDVPANEPASFQFIMGNVSATQETFTYAFTAGPESNPYSAEIFCNGAPMNQVQWYAIPYGTSIPVTVALERGPVEYDYDDLEIVLYSFCEDQRANDLGILPDTAENLYSAVYISAHFIRPCSEVNINVPEEDWVLFPDPLTPGPDDLKRITVSGYDTTEVNFQLIRVQYRRSDGDGAWINIPGISDRYNPLWSGYDALPDPKPPVLQKDFTQYFWETTGLSDGPYEIRAVSVCSGDASDRPGYSQVIKGRIDREPPSLVGLPQPSDGVYQVGDEISFTFNQDINCNQLIQADIFNDNNVGLYDATTNALIDANITCVDNKIVIDPLFQNEFYENHIMRAELHNIQDLTGNIMIEADWEFYVDRNELAWLTDSIGLTKYADENKVITAKIHNRGGYPVPFSIENIPDWVHVTPDAGTLVANEIRDIEFRVDSTLPLGWYADSIILHTETGQNPFFMGGDEFLPLGARVICRPPFWNLNPALYQLTMNMNLRLSINGSFSFDPEDQIGVFIAGQLRGTAKLTYVPAYDYWVAFVTVYGNTTDAGKPLVFEIFDASECLHYPGNLPGGFTFVSNSVVGSPNVPGIVTNSGMLLREIPVKVGWNWISFNLGFPNPAINTVLGNIPNPNNDLIKDQTKFSTYGSGTWSGALVTITNTTLYLYQATQSNTIKITGNPLTPASVPIPIVAGWNWIGYVPNFPLTVNAALASIPKTPGDIIKSQSSFAQYVDATIGWVGNLIYLNPLNGYLLKTAAAGTLTYPNQSFTNDPPIERQTEGNRQTFWSVDATQYEHNMTLIGMFQYNATNATTSNMELAAFVGDEIRGVAQAVYLEMIDAYMFFLTSYANMNGEVLHFKLYDPATGEIQLLQEKLTFSINQHHGSIAEPVPFSLQTTGTYEGNTDHSFAVQPNPFRNETTFRIVLPYDQDINLSICDLNGMEVSNLQIRAQGGLNSIVWNGLSHAGTQLCNGVYVVRLKSEQGITTRKVVLQR